MEEDKEDRMKSRRKGMMMGMISSGDADDFPSKETRPDPDPHRWSQSPRRGTDSPRHNGHNGTGAAPSARVSSSSVSSQPPLPPHHHPPPIGPSPLELVMGSPPVQQMMLPPLPFPPGISSSSHSYSLARLSSRSIALISLHFNLPLKQLLCSL